MATFPFLTLLPTVCDKVLTNVDLPDLFSFSSCSQRAFDLVKNRCESLEDQLSLTLTLRNTTKISLGSFPRRTDFINWHFLHKRNLIVPDLVNPKSYQFPFSSIDFCHRPRASLFESPTQLSTPELISFIKYIKELFNASLCHLHIDGKLDCIEELRLMFGTCSSLRTDTFLVSHEEMRSILKFPVRTYSVISCTPFPGFAYELPISAVHLFIPDAQWMTRQMLLNLKCINAALSNCKLTEEDLNHYLQQWFNSDSRAPQYIIFHKKNPNGSSDNGNWDFPKVVEGLPTVPGTPKRPDACSRFYLYNDAVHFENGVDLRRETDGMMASVVITEDASNEEVLVFVAWHVPNPNLP